jgi:hypothetical protein
MLRLTFDKEGNVKKAEIVVKKKLKPAKQRANQKQAKVWATKIARRGE